MTRTIVIIVFMMAVSCPILPGQDDYESLYNNLNAKIESELRQPPPSTNVLEEYLKWMQIKATDRNKAEELSFKAGREGNPYWERKFFELSDKADNSGEDTKTDAMFKLMRIDDRFGKPSGYQQACFAAGPSVGERIYTTASENGYITEDIKERARCMMRYATNDLEGNWLYTDHESFLGHYDANGFQVMPDGDWSIECMRRGDFTTTSQGDPIQPAENAMKMVQEVREICEFYHLSPEYDDATDLMIQYLKEKQVLCLNPSGKGHQWYMDLAKQYELDKAKEYMEGFYGTLKGKVEKEKNGVLLPVAGAEIEYEAPNDQKTWKTKTDNEGNYKIEKAILHKSCGPFIISARGDGCFKMEDVPGPLEEPDKNYELEKNLVLECGEEVYRGSVTIAVSWDYTDTRNDAILTYIGHQTMYYTGVFKPNPMMQEAEGQPLKMFSAQKVIGTWDHFEQRYCEGSGCGKCRGLAYEEWGSGNIPEKTLDGLVLITNMWPTDNKVVADQLAQFGMENWYDIATPTETMPTQTRSKYDAGDAGCQWNNSTSTTVLTGSDIRYKLKDIKNLSGKVSWSSESGSTGISVTNLTEAIYGQKPFDPEKNGTKYTYTITWNLKTY